MSSLKTSRWALLSKLSEMAPATVPAASRLACSDDAPQATVALRFTPEIFMIACEKTNSAARKAGQGAKMRWQVLFLIVLRNQCALPPPHRAT